MEFQVMEFVLGGEINNALGMGVRPSAYTEQSARLAQIMFT